MKWRKIKIKKTTCWLLHAKQCQLIWPDLIDHLSLSIGHFHLLPSHFHRSLFLSSCSFWSFTIFVNESDCANENLACFHDFLISNQLNVEWNDKNIKKWKTKRWIVRCFGDLWSESVTDHLWLSELISRTHKSLWLILPDNNVSDHTCLLWASSATLTNNQKHFQLKLKFWQAFWKCKEIETQ